MPTNKKYLALIGLGNWGKNLLRNFYELGVLHTACDIDKNLVKEAYKDTLPLPLKILPFSFAKALRGCL
ncbi:MAG: hypothetical protein ABIL18_09085 [candidate division WOR-3 bacterium]